MHGEAQPSAKIQPASMRTKCVFFLPESTSDAVPPAIDIVPAIARSRPVHSAILVTDVEAVGRGF